MPSLRFVMFALSVVLPLVARGQADSVVLARTDVPNAVLKQGEVRLLHRNGETIVQTILHTRFPGLVKKRITEKEQKNWADNPDAVTYLVVLGEALEQYALRKQESEESVALVIDLIDGLHTDRVDFSFGPMVQGKDDYRVHPVVVWRSLGLSRDYILRNQEYILADAFGRNAADVLEQLRTVRSNPESAAHD